MSRNPIGITLRAEELPFRGATKLMATETSSSDTAKVVAARLLAYCRANDWAGYDPYDACNSGLFQAFPPFDARLPRLVLTQLLKRSPVNIRRLVLIPRTQNPKGLALFLAATLRLLRVGGVLDEEALVGEIAERLLAMRSTGESYWCWGYSFPWQTRTLVVPRGAPNLVCTAFVADALLDAYDHFSDPRFLAAAVSAAEYIARQLYWTRGATEAGLNYPMPYGESRIHNANLLGAALLCRVGRQTGRDEFLEPALRIARYSAGRQHADGSWPYGEMPTQSWIDNFHTGFNLSGLRSVAEYGRTSEFDRHISKGFDFYRRHFFREDGAPRYFHDKTYPIDVHCVAQSVITLSEFQHLDAGAAGLADSVFAWAMKHMWDERGYFYYRVLRLCTIRTPYMRWGQAWMLRAVAALLEARSAAGSTAASQVRKLS